MPPKKKESKKSIKPPPSVDSSSQPTETIFRMQIIRIPKKPIYKAIRCQSETNRARLLQVKLWKAYSLRIVDKSDEWRRQNFQGEKQNLYKSLSSKTSRQSLKNIRKLYLHGSEDVVAFKKFFARKFRLKKLELKIPLNPQAIVILKGSVHPSLKHLILGCKKDWGWKSPWGRELGTWKDHMECISSFTSLEQLNLNSGRPEDSENSNYPIPKLRKLKTLVEDRGLLSLLLPKISKRPAKLQNLILFTNKWLSDQPLFTGRCNLDNILTLNLYVASNFDSPIDFIDFSLFSRLTGLSSLYLNVQGNSNRFFINDFAFLNNLKNLSLENDYPILPFAPSNMSSESIQLLPKLESLRISCWRQSSDLAFYKILLSKAQNLKSLNINTGSEVLNKLLEEPSLISFLEDLSVSTAFGSQTLLAFLEHHQNLKKLSLLFSESSPSIIEPILSSVESLAGLESFKLSVGPSTKLEDCKMPLLKDVLSKLEGLRFLNLQLPHHIFDSKELLGLTNALVKQQRLTNLVLNTAFGKLNQESFQKFVEFVKNARRVKSLQLCLQCAREKQIELEEVLGYDISYWEDFNATIAPPRCGL